MLGNAIRSRRESLGLSVVEAAKRGRISRATWTEVESGRRANITSGTAQGLAEALNWPENATDLVRAGIEPNSGSDSNTDPGDVSSAALIAALDRLSPGDRLRFEAYILVAAAEHVRSQIPADDE